MPASYVTIPHEVVAEHGWTPTKGAWITELCGLPEKRCCFANPIVYVGYLGYEVELFIEVHASANRGALITNSPPLQQIYDKPTNWHPTHLIWGEDHEELRPLSLLAPMDRDFVSGADVYVLWATAGGEPRGWTMHGGQTSPPIPANTDRLYFNRERRAYLESARSTKYADFRERPPIAQLEAHLRHAAFSPEAREL